MEQCQRYSKLARASISRADMVLTIYWCSTGFDICQDMDYAAFICYICEQGYSNKRNLTRHMSEEHADFLHPFTECLCRGRIIWREYMTKHLWKLHGIDEFRAKRLSQRVEKVEKQHSFILFQYYSLISVVSEDENFFENLVSQQTNHSILLNMKINENQQQNTEVAQEPCNSLKVFTDGLKQIFLKNCQLITKR